MDNMQQISLRRCERGYVIFDDNPGRIGMCGKMFAFDRVEDVASWLLKNFGQLETNQD